MSLLVSEKNDKGKHPERSYIIKSRRQLLESTFEKQHKKPLKNSPHPQISKRQGGKLPEGRSPTQFEAGIPGAFPDSQQKSVTTFSIFDEEDLPDVDLGESDVQPGSFFRRMKVMFYYPELLPISYEPPDLIHNDAGIYKVIFKDFRTGESHAYGHFPDAQTVVGREKNIRVLLYLSGTRKIMADAMFSKQVLREVRQLQIYPGFTKR